MNDLLVAARTLHFAGSALFTGGIFFWLLVAVPATAHLPKGATGAVADFCRVLRHLCLASAGVALVASIAWLTIVAADVSGRGADIVTSPGVIVSDLTQTMFGQSLTARMLVGVEIVALLLLYGLNGPRLYRVALAALCAGYLACFAWSGHAAATEEGAGIIHRTSDALHVLAACAWVGGVAPLALFLRAALRDADVQAARVATQRFGMLGLVCVSILIVTGGINTWYLAGTLPALLGTSYGQVLLIKIALFAVMLSLAAYNRFRLTPRIGMSGRNDTKARLAAITQLVRVCCAEAALGFAIFAVVAWLGTLPPGPHDEPTWPLPFRFVFGAFFDSDLRTPTVVASAIVIVGLVMLAAALAMRRRVSIWLALAGSAAILFYGRNLDVLTTEAFPTTFQMSPVAFSTAEIAQGHALFTEHCAACHGARGTGDGPAAARLKVKPANLTADHIYGHTDGDLFWRLSVGLGDTMPAFGNVLDADARWRLVHFVHANADSPRLASLRGRVTYAAFPAPRFSVDCPDGPPRVPEDFNGRPVHVILAGAASAARLDQLAVLEKSGDVTTLVVTLDDSKTGAFCTTSAQDVIAVLADYRGAETADTIDGTEFLIDANWQLRAMWHPGLGNNWLDPIIFRRQIAEMANPQVLPGNLVALNPEFGDTPLKYFPGADDGHAYHRH